MELDGVVAIVTGAGDGLGKVIAQKMFGEGALLSLWDMNGGTVSSLAKELDPSGKRVFAVQVNVTDEPAVQEAVKKTAAKFGRIDAIVNNAGISRHKPIEEMSVELFKQVIDVNLLGPFICCKAVTGIMKAQHHGKIVNIASLGGRTGRPGVGVNYAASKAGVIGLTQTIAKELGPYDIYANAVCPGPILTEQTRQYPKEVFATWNAGRCVTKDGMPEDVADAVIFLASGRSDWITGICLDVNGGILIK